jgi:fibronectin type 3 domain-containing protein
VTTTSSTGTYSFSGLANGSYVVAPSQTGYSFSPSTAAVSISGASVNGVNFSAAALPPISRTVSLSWMASTSPNIVGYNVYRATASGGGYVKLNGSPVSGTSYIDASVIAGQVYYYVATAVDGSSNESVYSAEASAQVPLT